MTSVQAANAKIEALVKERARLADPEFRSVLANQIQSVRVSLEEAGSSPALNPGMSPSHPAVERYRENLVALQGLIEGAIPLVLQRLQEIDAARIRLDSAASLARSYGSNS